ncbi:unnamed protein product [Rotaria socialis]|uniref:Uncharacterized protein n=1 Tax=Rotaria socialis TaxID=392032 RepID=A0A821K9X2_9BILA|nr:unnamed protein product [Rotaria socialis]
MSQTHITQHIVILLNEIIISLNHYVSILIYIFGTIENLLNVFVLVQPPLCSNPSAILATPHTIQQLYLTFVPNTPEQPLHNAIDKLIYDSFSLLTFIASGMPFYIYTIIKKESHIDYKQPSKSIIGVAIFYPVLSHLVEYFSFIACTVFDKLINTFLHRILTSECESVDTASDDDDGSNLIPPKQTKI